MAQRQRQPRLGIVRRPQVWLLVADRFGGLEDRIGQGDHLGRVDQFTIQPDFLKRGLQVG